MLKNVPQIHEYMNSPLQTLVLRLGYNENNGGTEWRGIQQLLLPVGTLSSKLATFLELGTFRTNPRKCRKSIRRTLFRSAKYIRPRT